jgi:hypothetical protein
MNWQEMVPQYLAGQLTAVEKARFEAELSGNAELRAEVEQLSEFWEALGTLPKEQPSAAMRARFYQKLHALTKTAAPSAPSWFSKWRLRPIQQFGLGLVLFTMGIFVGHAVDSSRVSQQLSQLHEEVRNMRQTVALSLLDRQSANARLEGVSWGTRVERPDREVSTALLTALNHDANVNVRLSSVDALTGLANDPAIRGALLDSIPTQESPLVQIALIDALVQIHDTAASGELTRIAHDAQYNANVRQRAEWALQKLQ